MRKSTRILAALLSILMLCGLLPFSLFAAEATEGDGSSDASSSEKSYAELVAEYVAAKGGSLYYAQDFSATDNVKYSENKEYYTDAVDAAYITSLVGGSKKMSIVPKSDLIEVKDGVLYIKSQSDNGAPSTNSDPFVQVELGGVSGKTLISEFTFTVAEPMGVGSYTVMYSKQYYTGGYIDFQGLYLKVEAVKDADGNETGERTYTYYTSMNKPLVAAKVGESISFKVVQSFVNGLSYYYVNGEYKFSDSVTSYNSNIYASLKNGVCDPSLVRLGHLPAGIADQNACLAIDDIYVYCTSVPYGCESCYGDNYTESTLAPYLSASGDRILGGSDFENANAKWSTYDLACVDDLVLWDSHYNFEAGTYDGDFISGTQWTITSATAKYGHLLFHCKANVGNIEVEDGNTYLSVEQPYPQCSDSYVDAYQKGYVAGTDFVATVSLRRHLDTNWGFAIFNFVWRSFGNGQTGTAADGSTATNSSTAKWMQMVNCDAQGAIYVVDYATGSAKNVYVGQLYADEFTQLSLAIHPSTGLADIYVNGYKMYTFTFMNANDFKSFEKDGVTYNYDNFSVKDFYFDSNRCQIEYVNNRNLTSRYTGGHDVDNMFFYTGSTPVESKGDVAVPTGWQQDSETGYWRYYTTEERNYSGRYTVPGVSLVGNQEVGGTQYFFELGNAYVSQLQRDSIYDLEGLYSTKGAQGDQRVQMAGSLHLAPSNGVKGSGKWTYLWADAYTDAENTKGRNPTAYLNANYKGSDNGVSWEMQLNPALSVTSETAKSKFAARFMQEGMKYIDFTGYAGIEVVTYTQLDSDFGFVIQVACDSVSADTPGYVDIEAWNKIIWNSETKGTGSKPANYTSTYVMKASENGWNTKTFYFENYTNASSTDPNKGTLGIGRIGTKNRILSISFETGWSNIKDNYANYNTAKIYLDNIYAVRYAPVTEIPVIGLVETDKGTYNYTTTYNYSTGWADIDSDGVNDHYFYPYTGLMATGLTVIDGVGVLFDDNGVLVSEKATGRYTVDGIDCIYVDGKLQTGAFTYEGVNYFASPVGKIYSEIGTIGYEYDAEYTSKTFGDDVDIVLSENFDSIAVGTIYGNYSGKDYITSGTIKNASGAYINLVAKLTHFTVIEREEGNNALEITNDGGGVDAYINFNLKYESKYTEKVNGKDVNIANPDTGKFEFQLVGGNGDKIDPIDAEGNAKVIIFEHDVKLGDDWNTTSTAFQPIAVSLKDGSRKNVCSVVTMINEQGYLVLNGTNKVICKLSTDTYTNIAYSIDVSNYTCDVYVNGVLMVSDKVFYNGTDELIITEGRIMQYPQDKDGTAYIDNLNVYFADEPVGYSGAVASKSGWVTEGGIKRYYQNGLMLTSAATVPDEDGVERIYYFDSANGMCTGAANGWIGGLYYIDGAKGVNCWIENGTQYVGADSKLVKGGYVIDGVGYYFNKSTGILEQVVSGETVLFSVKDILNANKSYTADRKLTTGGIAASANIKGFKNLFDAELDEAVDSTKYDAVKLDIYVGETYDADFAIKLTNYTRMYVATDVVCDENGNYKSANVTDEYVIKSDYANGYFTDTSKYLALNGVNYRVHYRENEEGERTYYFQHMAYLYKESKLDYLTPGWNSVILELSTFQNNNYVDATSINYVGIVVSGWGLNGNGQFAEGAESFDIRLGNISFVKYAELGTEKLNGFIDGKYYDNDIVYSTGWTEVEGNTYYFNFDGTPASGYKLIDGKWYQFGDNGLLSGLANGEVKVTNTVKRDGKWVETEITMFFVDGVAQSGVQTVSDGSYCICDEDGIPLANATKKDGDYVYQSDSEGVATRLTSQWYEEDGNKYYLKSNGKMYKNTVKQIDGAYYSFGKTGIMETNTLKTTTGGTQFFGEDGKALVSGMYTFTVDGAEKTAYFNDNGYITVPEDHIIDGVEYAFDEDGFITGPAEVNYGNEVASGVCGPELTWVYYDSNTLVISGNGAMNEYSAGKAPWSAYKKTATTVIIEEGVVSVGQAAFYEFSALNTVKLPSSLILIGQYAFFQCKALTSLEIPANVASIGYYAFRKCGFKTGSLTFKNTEGWVSADQTVVTDAQVAAAVTDPATAGAFFVNNSGVRYDRQFTEVGETIASGKCGKNLTWAMSENGVLTVSGTGEMYKYSAKTMPWVAYKAAILKIVIEEGVTTIGNAAFYEANNVISVSFPSTLESIGNYSFFSLIILDELTIPENVTYIGRYAFRKLKSLESFKLEALYGWTVDGQMILSAQISDPAEAVAVLATYAKKDWTRDPDATAADEDPNIVVSGSCGKNLNWKITLDGTLTISGTGAMSNYASNNMPTWYENIDLVTSIVIEEGVTTVGNFAFYFTTANKTITSVSLPSTLTSIGNYAFFNCKGITEITVPAAVTSIGSNALRKTASSITLENTYGWSAGETALDASELSDPQTVGSLFHGTYYSSVWTCTPDGGNAAALSGDADFTANY